MHLRECLKVSSLLLLTLVLSSCSSWPKLTQIEVQTVEVERNIPTQNRPQPIRMNTTMKWWVVTEENFKEFKEKFQKENLVVDVVISTNAAMKLSLIHI